MWAKCRPNELGMGTKPPRHSAHHERSTVYNGGQSAGKYCAKLKYNGGVSSTLPGLGVRQSTTHQKETTMSKCKFCNSTSFGSCSGSPHKKHEHSGMDEKHCVFCNSTSYGSCINSPHKKHQHGSGANKCIYCGSTSTGSCSSSPHGKHEK